MNKVVRTSLLAALLTATLMINPAAFAQESAASDSREDLHYVGLLATTFNHRSIGEITNEAAWGTGGTLIVGGHITDLFHAELRAGGGFKDAEVPNSDLTLTVDYFASWYIGMHHPITDYANIYGQFGFSYISGEAELRNSEADRNRQFQTLEGEFPDSGFSVSWLAGLDFEVMTNTFLVFEGGKLFEDTGTEVNTFQFSGGLRYEF
ncbi:outer membrane beta-barrel protein [Marinobacter sp. M216]|uniref:Outer membrane beta-barrel protein n=1 Tax=Marinobacter albus TaxID=3030833 RepID=A0ABT7HFB8_9GAMM|nr:outer membrane beta-barrel protein [Marinobacter sp. M216]MDK9558190.1 outer membrane beta-barrel protein [Marinobacter sp. M216]